MLLQMQTLDKILLKLVTKKLFFILLLKVVKVSKVSLYLLSMLF